MKTAQETFDTISNHLLTQNQKSEDPIYLCKFRHGNLKCAVGCLIEDINYMEEIENHNISWLIEHGYLTDYSHHAVMLDSLRRVHDDYNVEEWPVELQNVAKAYGLQFKRD